MDFSVKDFNVRLRTIKLWEIIIAIVISFFLTLFVEGYFNISSGELEYILFFCFMMVFFLIATYGTTGFNKDVNDLFKALIFLLIQKKYLLYLFYCSLLLYLHIFYIKAFVLHINLLMNRLYKKEFPF